MKKKRYLAASVVGVAMLTACGDRTPSTADMSQLDDEGVLKVATRNAGTTYYIDRHQRPTGPEHDLVYAFARDNDWDIEWHVLDSTADVLQALDEGRVHLAAAGLTQTRARNERFARGPAHTEVRQQLVCHRELQPRPRRTADLVGLNIQVTANSSYADTLRKLQTQHDDLTFSETSRHSTETLLGHAAERRIDCTVADSNIVQITRRHWPVLDVKMNLNEGENLGWYSPESLPDVAEAAAEWMTSHNGDLAIAAMEARYYAYIATFDFVDMRALNRRMDERLPQYRRLFLEAERETGMPADLLAALAYQESHWDPEARSATGVRGLMMLTQRTAESLGVDRLNPGEAVQGGARYLADLHARLPDTIPEPDRTYLALASYNIGRAHLLDARQLARELDMNPDSWRDMEQVLPLKADRRYYPRTRHGYARGYEPVHYVQRIRNYRDVIENAFD